MRTPDDWNLVILPWALENWLAINHITMTKPESVCTLVARHRFVRVVMILIACRSV
jgi:hypothetical protein